MKARTGRISVQGVSGHAFRLPRKGRPVPPIFQPEVAADAIHFAAHHPRREFSVGWPSVKAILANKFIPGLLDHYLAGAGYDFGNHVANQ